jgi:hypothetical protein
MAMVKLSSGGLRPDGLRPAKTIVVVRDGIALRVNAALSESRVRESSMPSSSKLRGKVGWSTMTRCGHDEKTNVWLRDEYWSPRS